MEQGIIILIGFIFSYILGIAIGYKIRAMKCDAECGKYRK